MWVLWGILILSAAVVLYCQYRVSRIWGVTPIRMRILWVIALAFWFLSWAVLGGRLIDSLFGVS